MKINGYISVFLLVTLLACTDSPPPMPDDCNEFITVSDTGHYLLNRSAVTDQNADRINECLEELGIQSLRVVPKSDVVD